MAPSSIDKQTADYDSPYDWLMNLAMDLATYVDALCDNQRWKCHLYSVCAISQFLVKT